MGGARVQIAPKPGDRSAFAGRITPLKHTSDAGARVLRPSLQLDQFDLKLRHFALIDFTRHPFGMGVIGCQNVALVRTFDGCADVVWRVIVEIGADCAVKGQVHGASRRECYTLYGMLIGLTQTRTGCCAINCGLNSVRGGVLGHMASAC